jgi:hypothetical protein
MFEVATSYKITGSQSRFFQTENALIEYIKRLRKDAKILYQGKIIGRVWKENRKWNWYIAPDLIEAED